MVEHEVGDDDLARRVVAAGTRDPEELVARLLGGLREDAAEWQRDDITLVAVRRTA